jgi:thiol-disulfide isomerase/thioredoxin
MQRFFFIMFLFCTRIVQAQGGYQPGNVVSNLAFPKVLNTPYTVSSLEKMKGQLTLLDFFGTWCVPCMKALPNLTRLQQENKNIRVILVSIEEESKLKAFLAKRPDFPFPIVVDERETITALFQPPSLPYTVVVDENGKILAITDAAEITGEKIAAWLAGKGEEMKAPELPINKRTSQTTTTSFMQSSNKSIALSQDFIYAAKTGDGTAAFVDKLKAMDYETLKSSLTTDAEKKAFWINLYNGFTQYFLQQNSSQYRNRNKFFSKKQINVAGKTFSLDAIEHGILRRSKIKWSLGHLNKFFPGKTEKELRLDTVDYRIHFALNCGAKSCPPIAFYAPERLEQQLDMATKSYLSSEVALKEADNTVYLPAIMGWFREDFCGKNGMRELLRKQGYANVNTSTKIRFKKYDWNLYLDNFKNL